MGTQEEQHVVIKEIRSRMDLERRVRAVVWFASVILVVWAFVAVIRFAWLCAALVSI